MVLPAQVRTRVNAAGQWGEEQGIAVADHVFWMGDLNYRLNMPDGLVSRSDKRCRFPRELKRDLLDLLRKSDCSRRRRRTAASMQQ